MPLAQFGDHERSVPFPNPSDRGVRNTGGFKRFAPRAESVHRWTEEIALLSILHRGEGKVRASCMQAAEFGEQCLIVPGTLWIWRVGQSRRFHRRSERTVDTACTADERRIGHFERWRWLLCRATPR